MFKCIRLFFVGADGLYSAFCNAMAEKGAICVCGGVFSAFCFVGGKKWPEIPGYSRLFIDITAFSRLFVKKGKIPKTPMKTALCRLRNQRVRVAASQIAS